MKGVNLEIDKYKLSKLKHRIEKKEWKRRKGKRKQNKPKDIPGTVKKSNLYNEYKK